MHKLAIAVALIAVLGTTTARAEWVSCNTFIQRLREAGRVVGFPLPPLKVERNASVTDHDAFWISYPYTDREKEGSLDCTDGHVDDYEMDIDNYSTQRSVHIVAAALYAYTGGPAGQNVALAIKLIAKHPHDVRSIVKEELPNEGMVSVGFDSVLVSSKCDPAVSRCAADNHR